MFCPECGKEIPDGSKFCGYCAADLRTFLQGSPAVQAGPQMSTQNRTVDRPLPPKKTGRVGKNESAVTREYVKPKRKFPKRLVGIVALIAIAAVAGIIIKNLIFPGTVKNDDELLENTAKILEETKEGYSSDDGASNSIDNMIDYTRDESTNQWDSENERYAENLEEEPWPSVIDGDYIGDNLLSDEREVEYTLTRADGFSEGLAWIRFELDGEEYSGCINEEGKLQFYYRGSLSGEKFENGYSYFQTSSYSDVYMIDREGNILSSYKSLPAAYIVGQPSTYQVDGARAWGGGCFVLQTFSSSFDEPALYEYRIIDKDGNTLWYFWYSSDTPLLEIYYLGDGVFSYSYKKNVTNLYFTKTDTQVEGWVSYDYMNNVKTTDGIFVFYCGKYNGDTFMSVGNAMTGEYYDVMIPEEYGYSPIVRGVSDGYILLEEEKVGYYLYDIINDSFRWYDGKYANSLYWENAVNLEQSYGLDNGIFAISLKGQDGKQYIGLIDYDMNEVCEPILGKNFSVQDGMLFEKSTYTLYNLSGEKVRSFYYYPDLNDFGDGIMVTDDNRYLFYDGSEAIESIDYSTGKFIAY